MQGFHYSLELPPGSPPSHIFCFLISTRIFVLLTIFLIPIPLPREVVFLPKLASDRPSLPDCLETRALTQLEDTVSFSLVGQ